MVTYNELKIFNPIQSQINICKVDKDSVYEDKAGPRAGSALEATAF